MSKFITKLSLFMAGLPLLLAKSGTAYATAESLTPNTSEPPDAVSLKPLNDKFDNLFAAHRSHVSHRSHSSHSSHSSHYSSSTGGRSSTTPTYTPPPTLVTPPASSPPSVAPQNTAPVLSTGEKLTLQVMRVQIALTGLGLYDGSIDGVFGEETQTALRYFQTLKELPVSGLMTTETLDALGVKVVN